MPGQTSRGIIFPVVGDNISPLASWFATQASSANDAIDDIYAQFEEPTYPAPLTSDGVEQQVVSATSWADLPNSTPIVLTLERACWVTITLGCWLQAAGAGWTRASFSVSGATTLGESQAQVGGSSGAWGQVAMAQDGRHQTSITKFVRLNPGENTIKVRAYQGAGGSTKRCDYASLQVSPIRWA